MLILLRFYLVKLETSRTVVLPPFVRVIVCLLQNDNVVL